VAVERDLAALCDLAVSLARNAGRLQLERRHRLVVHGTKAHPNDLVTDVDLASERLLADGLAGACPRDSLTGEEGGSRVGTSGWTWVVDPLDGTRNYVTGSGPWAVSMALCHGGVARVGVVHDPVAGDTFAAVSGDGTRLNGVHVAPSPSARLPEAVVGMSYGTSQPTRERVAPVLAAVLPQVGDIRRLPAALHLAYLAAGRLDAGIIVDAGRWDVAAGLFLAMEAGVVLGGLHGTPVPELIVGSGPALWPDLRALLAATSLGGELADAPGGTAE
jgi:myo-inositol-1(or 4)-monophosphatase